MLRILPQKGEFYLFVGIFGSFHDGITMIIWNARSNIYHIAHHLDN